MDANTILGEHYTRFISDNGYSNIDKIINAFNELDGFLIRYQENCVIQDNTNVKQLNGNETKKSYHIDVIIDTPFKDTELHIEVWDQISGNIQIIKLIRHLDPSGRYKNNVRRYFCLEWIPGISLRTSMYGDPKSDTCLDIYHVSDMLRHVQDITSLTIKRGDSDTPLELIDYDNHMTHVVCGMKDVIMEIRDKDAISDKFMDVLVKKVLPNQDASTRWAEHLMFMKMCNIDNIVTHRIVAAIGHQESAPEGVGIRYRIPSGTLTMIVYETGVMHIYYLDDSVFDFEIRLLPFHQRGSDFIIDPPSQLPESAKQVLDLIEQGFGKIKRDSK